MGAVHATHGFMDYDLCEAEFSRAAMAQAERCIVAADSSVGGQAARGTAIAALPRPVSLTVPNPRNSLSE